MKNLALCFYGFLRDWEKHVKDLRKCIIEPYNPDIYLFTPWEVDADHLSQSVSSKELRQAFPERDLTIERWHYNRVNFIRDANYLPKYNLHYQRPFRIFSMAFHISRSISLISEKYQWIYLTRPDIPIAKFDLSLADPNKINIREGGHLVRPYEINFDDKYILGSGEDMQLWESFYDKIKNDYIKNSDINFVPNNLLCHHIIQNDLAINNCDFTRDISSHTCNKLCGHHVKERLDELTVEQEGWLYFKEENE